MQSKFNRTDGFKLWVKFTYILTGMLCCSVVLLLQTAEHNEMQYLLVRITSSVIC